MKSLLSKTIRPIIIYALLILTLSIPAYYFIIDFLWVHELDKHHRNIQNNLQQQLKTIHGSELASKIGIWNQLQPNAHLEKVTCKTNDQAFTYLEEANHNREQYRVWISYLTLDETLYRLRIQTNMEETDETIAAIAGVTVLFWILLITGFLVLTRRMTHQLWQPFYQTLSLLRTFQINQSQTITFTPTSVSEFDQLNVSISVLMERNRLIYLEQKEFTENASHELQTPLAILQTKLDLLLQSENLTQIQYEIINEMSRTLSRTSRINRNLLLLTKLENQQFERQEEVMISNLVLDQVLILEDYFSVKNLRINTEVERIVVLGNQVLVETLLSNLLMNAIRYTPSHGKISIILKDKNLIISNTGTVSLNPNNLFKRFRSVSTSASGTGLGLAIVQRICQLHGWSISYQYTSDYHCFQIEFK